MKTIVVTEPIMKIEYKIGLYLTATFQLEIFHCIQDIFTVYTHNL
jgi:hypothetical protein